MNHGDKNRLILLAAVLAATALAVNAILYSMGLRPAQSASAAAVPTIQAPEPSLMSQGRLTPAPQSDPREYGTFYVYPDRIVEMRVAGSSIRVWPKTDVAYDILVDGTYWDHVPGLRDTARRNWSARSLPPNTEYAEYRLSPGQAPVQFGYVKFVGRDPGESNESWLEKALRSSSTRPDFEYGSFLVRANEITERPMEAGEQLIVYPNAPVAYSWYHNGSLVHHFTLEPGSGNKPLVEAQTPGGTAGYSLDGGQSVSSLYFVYCRTRKEPPDIARWGKIARLTIPSSNESYR